jgi:two-component system chemotaxis response regulator CheB
VELLEIENRIALGVSTIDDWWDLARASSPSGLSCPDCHCSLYELADKRIVRFRCRSGHGYSAEILLSGQEIERETLLASMFGALLEEAARAARLSTLPQELEDATHVTHLQDRAARLRGEAEQIGAWRRATSCSDASQSTCPSTCASLARVRSWH